MRQLDEYGVALSIRRIIDRVRRGDGCCMSASTSISSIRRIAPGVGTAVPGGATYREAHLVMELLYEFRARRPRSISSSSIRSSTSGAKARCCWSTRPPACSAGRSIEPLNRRGVGLDGGAEPVSRRPARELRKVDRPETDHPADYYK